MRILFDIGHPAHAHYFKNLITILHKNNHKCFVIARDKEVTFEILKAEKIEFKSRGKGGKSLFSKLLYMLKGDLIVLNEICKFKPDVCVSFGSPYLAHASKLMRIPHIAITDTENAKLGILSFKAFTETILTPSCFLSNWGIKQIRFQSYMELSYLHPKYFKFDSNNLELINFNDSKPFVIFRFVSWNANHDYGQKGLSLDFKVKLVKEISKKYSVYISSEGDLPDELQEYSLKIPPEKLHDVLFLSSLYIGEGATTASECVMLGTPAIYVNSLNSGTLQEQEKYGLLYGFRNTNGVLEKALELLEIQNLKLEFQILKEKMLTDKIDITSFLVWFIENYPNSKQIMKDNPNYQYNFK